MASHVQGASNSTEEDIINPWASSENVGGDVESNESTPLLSNQTHRKATPLPLAQLLLLAAVRLAEPVAFTQIFPYVNQMVEDLGIADDPADVGYYSGLVDATFSFAQIFTIYFWSSLSDRIGRKPVLIIGLTGATISSGCFGFSRTLPQMLAARFIAGALSGNIAVVSSMLSEITDETNQGKAFPLIGATWNIGSVIGPMLGGTFSRPATQWPTVFTHPIFREYPYMLPCIVSSSLSLFAILLCAIFVNETLPSIVAKKQAQSSLSKLSSSSSATTCSSASSYTSSTIASSTLSSTQPASEEKPEGIEIIKMLLKQKHVRAVLGTAFMISFLSIGFEAVFVLYSYTAVRLGGMGLRPNQIGYALALSGSAGAVSAILFFPYIQVRFNNRHLYTFFVSFWIAVWLLMPIGNIAAKTGNSALVWSAIVAILIPLRLAANAYILNGIIIKASVDRKDQLGSLFGLQQSCSSIARAIAPPITSSLFATMIEGKVPFIPGLVWMVMMLSSLWTVKLAWNVRDVPAVVKR